jgi:hypothetical protein
MASEKVVLEFEANLAGMQRALASIPDMTEKEAKDAVRQLRKSFLAAEKAAKKAAKVQGKSFKRAAKEIDQSAEQTGEGLKRMAQAVGGKTGEMAGRVEALGQSVAALATPLGAGTAAAVAMTAAVTGLAAGMVAAVFAADDFIDDLKELRGLEGFELLPADQVEAIETVNGSLDAVVAVAKQATVTIGGEFAPALENAAVGMVALNLAALDMLKQFVDAIDVFQVVGDTIIDAVLGPIDHFAKGLGTVVQGLALVAEAAGQDQLAGKLNEAVDAMTQLRGQLNTSTLMGAAGVALDIADGYGNYTERARELIGTLEEVDTTQKSVQTSTKDLDAEIEALTQGNLASFTKALEAEQKALEQVAAIGTAARKSQLTAEQALQLQYADQLLAIEELSTAHQENFAIQQAAAASRLAVEADYYAQLQQLRAADDAKAKASAVQRRDDGIALAQSLIHTSDQLTQARMQNIDTTTAAGRAEAEQMFNVQKALAIVSVIIDGALATSKAFAQFGPPPSPMGIAAAAAAAAQTGAAAALIASQKPEFPMGGIVPSIDHQLIAAQPGEAVLNRSAVDRLGPSGVDAINNGRMPGGEMVVQMVYEHRVFNSFVADSLSAGGPLTNALNRRSGPPGHSRRRR